MVYKNIILRQEDIPGVAAMRQGFVDSNYIYCNDITPDLMYVLDKRTWSIIRTVSHPAAINTGFCVYGNFWYFTDFGTDLIYKCLKFTNTIVSSFSIFDFAPSCGSLAVNDKYIVTAQFNTSILYFFNHEGILVKQLDVSGSIGNTFGLQFFNDKLIVMSNYGPTLIMVDQQGRELFSHITSTTGGTGAFYKDGYMYIFGNLAQLTLSY